MAVVFKRSVSGAKLRRFVLTAGSLNTSTPKPVGGLNQAIFSNGDRAENCRLSKLYKKHRRLSDKENVRAHFASEAEYQLWRGDTAFGKSKVMTGREVFDLNKQYELKFLNDKSEGSRLWRWLPVGKKPIPKGTTYADYRKYNFVQSV